MLLKVWFLTTPYANIKKRLNYAYIITILVTDCISKYMCIWTVSYTSKVTIEDPHQMVTAPPAMLNPPTPRGLIQIHPKELDHEN